MQPRPVTYSILRRILKRLAQACCHWIAITFARYVVYKYILTSLPLGIIIFRRIAYITSVWNMDILEDPDDLPRLSEALAEFDSRPMLHEASRLYEALKHSPPAPDFSVSGQARDLRMTPFAGFVANTQSYPGSIELVEHYRAGFLTITDYRKLTIQDKHKLLTICFAYKTKARVMQYLDYIVEQRVRWAPRLRGVVRTYGRDSGFAEQEGEGTKAAADAGAENQDPSGAQKPEDESTGAEGSIQGAVSVPTLPPIPRRMNLPLLSPAGGISIPRFGGETHEKTINPTPPTVLHVPTPSWALPAQANLKPNENVPPTRLHVPIPPWALPAQSKTKPNDNAPPTVLHVPTPSWALTPQSNPKPNDNAPPASTASVVSTTSTPSPLLPPHSRPKHNARPAQEEIYFVIPTLPLAFPGLFFAAFATHAPIEHLVPSTILSYPPAALLRFSHPLKDMLRNASLDWWSRSGEPSGDSSTSGDPLPPSYPEFINHLLHGREELLTEDTDLWRLAKNEELGWYDEMDLQLWVAERVAKRQNGPKREGRFSSLRVARMRARRARERAIEEGRATAKGAVDDGDKAAEQKREVGDGDVVAKDEANEVDLATQKKKKRHRVSWSEDQLESVRTIPRRVKKKRKRTRTLVVNDGTGEPVEVVVEESTEESSDESPPSSPQSSPEDSQEESVEEGATEDSVKESDN
jgi:hypothetical protein